MPLLNSKVDNECLGAPLQVASHDTLAADLPHTLSEVSVHMYTGKWRGVVCE